MSNTNMISTRSLPINPAVPFELRFEELKLAREFLENRYQGEMQKVAMAKDYGYPMVKEFPKFPTEEDIIRLANKFKIFVDTGK